jgi:excisionase family DNA binding protein
MSLMDITSPERPAADKSMTLLAVADVAQATGLSQRTIRRYIGSGALPARRAGGRVLIRDTDLAAWFESLEPAEGKP